MHDPKTLAFDIKIPIGHDGDYGLHRYAYLVSIWHVDPDADGSGDSCGWAFAHLSEAEKAAADALITSEGDNVRHWFAQARDDEEAKWQLRRLWRLYKTELRPWWRHPRWHFWHWEIQVHAVQNFLRWAFSRCAGCGGRFPWGYAPITHHWQGEGPGWFHGERGVFHHECAPPPQA